MLDRLTFLVGTDVTRLYRTLQTAGVDLSGAEPGLSGNVVNMARTGFHLIQRALRQVVPEIQMEYDGHLSAGYALPTPALNRVPDAVHCDINRRIHQHYQSYKSCIQTWLIRDLEFTYIQLTLTIDIPTERWYAEDHSLCALCRTLIATAQEIIALERQYRTAGAVAGTQ